MRKVLTYMMALMLMACSSSGEADEKAPQEEEQTMLSFYVYAPEHPIMTRANDGESDASEAEAKVNSIQIWVFEHEYDDLAKNGKLVAYYEPTSTENLNGTKGGDVYQVPVSRSFADRRPRVDVLVLANVTTDTHGKKYDKNTSREELQQAVLDNSHFGTEPLIISVPSDGLPMSGVLLNQPVTGEKPVLRIGTDYSEMATVRLVRMVSKMRFVFSSLTGSNVQITGITIDAGLMASVEFLFLNGPFTGRNTNVSQYWGYEATLLAPSLGVKGMANPLDLIFIEGVESPQEYESRINTAVENGEATSVGPYYLHESDQKLKGKVKYKVGDDDEKTAVFEMAEAGDFSRNHTWLIYAYYGDAVLKFNLVDVNGWTDRDVRDHGVYNW